MQCCSRQQSQPICRSLSRTEWNTGSKCSARRSSSPKDGNELECTLHLLLVIVLSALWGFCTMFTVQLLLLTHSRLQVVSNSSTTGLRPVYTHRLILICRSEVHKWGGLNAKLAWDLLHVGCVEHCHMQ